MIQQDGKKEKLPVVKKTGKINPNLGNGIDLLVVFAVGFLIRFMFLIFTKTNPLVVPKAVGLDSYLYDRLAHSLLAGNFFDPRFLWTMPLYPYILALFYKMSGMSFAGVRFLQILIGSLNCMLIYKIGKKFFNRRAGIIAGILASGYALFIFHELILIGFFLKVLLALGATLVLSNYFERPDNVRLILSGALCGLLMLSSADSVIFVLCIFLMLVFGKDKLSTRKRGTPILFILAVCAIILPVTVRNYLISGEFIPFSSHAGMNFYIGNNPRSTGTYLSPFGQHAGSDMLQVTAKAEAERYLGRKLSAKEISDYWFHKGLDFITDAPFRYIRLVIRKVGLFFSPTEMYDVLDCDFLRRHFIAFNTPLFNFWFVFPLGLIGIFLSYKKRHKLKILHFFMVSVFLSNILFFVNARYRLEIMPVIIMFAGYSISWFMGKIERKSYWRAAMFLLILFSLIVILNLLRTVRAGEATSFCNIGHYYSITGDYDKALGFYKNALLIEPTYTNAYFGMGNAYHKKKLYEKAISCYKKAIELEPNHFRAYSNMGSVYVDIGDFEHALIAFQKANHLHPNHPLICKNLDFVLQQTGRMKKQN